MVPASTYGAGRYRRTGIQSGAWHLTDPMREAFRAEVRAAAVKRGARIYDVNGALLEILSPEKPHR
jgi:hypothetical protein